MESSANKALLIVAHGSRRQQSNDEIRTLAHKVAKQAGERFHYVDCAFLELAEPSIQQGIDNCVANGADEVIVMPYFLSAGRHVVEDVPGIVKAKQQDYPDAKLRFSPYLGASPVMTQLILETVESGACLCGEEKAECAYPSCME